MGSLTVLLDQHQSSYSENLSTSSFSHHHCEDTKMKFTRVPVLSVVLVCAIVFSGCVAQKSFCQGLLEYVREVEPCIPGVEHLLKTAPEWCPSTEDKVLLDEIIYVIRDRSCAVF